MNAMTPGSMLGGFGLCTRAMLLHEKGPAPREAPVQRLAQPAAVSSTAPSDFPPRSCDLLVRPFGSASTYSRAPLGAKGNLEAGPGPCKVEDARKNRILRLLNSQHFHSTVCNVWITPDHAPNTVRTSAEIGRPVAGSR